MLGGDILIRCNLAVLLAEQNLKITTVSKETGISRTTLTALSNNHGQGIQFDTLNTLCKYLDVSPEQLLSYHPTDITVFDVEVSEKKLIVTINTEGKAFHASLLLKGVILQKGNDGLLLVFEPVAFDKVLNSTYDIFSKLPRPFLNDIERDIKVKTAIKLGPFKSIDVVWESCII